MRRRRGAARQARVAAARAGRRRAAGQAAGLPARDSVGRRGRRRKRRQGCRGGERAATCRGPGRRPAAAAPRRRCRRRRDRGGAAAGSSRSSTSRLPSVGRSQLHARAASDSSAAPGSGGQRSHVAWRRGAGDRVGAGKSHGQPVARPSMVGLTPAGRSNTTRPKPGWSPARMDNGWGRGGGWTGAGGGRAGHRPCSDNASRAGPRRASVETRQPCRCRSGPWRWPELRAVQQSSAGGAAGNGSAGVAAVAESGDDMRHLGSRSSSAWPPPW